MGWWFGEGGPTGKGVPRLEPRNEEGIQDWPCQRLARQNWRNSLTGVEKVLGGRYFGIFGTSGIGGAVDRCGETGGDVTDCPKRHFRRAYRLQSRQAGSDVIFAERLAIS